MAKFTCNFISYTLVRTVDITVVIPSVTIPEAMGAPNSPFRKIMKVGANLETGDFNIGKNTLSHRKDAKFPVLYLLHGYGNNHATWTGYTNLELYAEEHNVAVVMLSAENKSYVDHGSVDRFFEFVSVELPDFVCSMFPVSDKPEHTYIAGLSMGGYGALVHGLSTPERFAAIGAFSAAVELNTAAMAGFEHEAGQPLVPKELALKLHKAGKKFPKMYISCGKKDPLFDADKSFYELLKSMKVDVTWDEDPDYGHEWRFWDQQAEKFLRWMPRTDAFNKGGTRQI